MGVQTPYLNHAFCRTKNRNTSVLRWVKVPSEIVAKVIGAGLGTEREGIIWGCYSRDIRDRRLAVLNGGGDHMSWRISIVPLCWIMTTSWCLITGLYLNGFPTGYSRVLEVAPDCAEVVWSYEGEEKSSMLFSSSTMSSCQRLPNGDTFICEGTMGRLFEVSSRGELVWEFVNNLPSYEASPIKRKPYPVYSAYRYGMVEAEFATGAPAVKKGDEAGRSRLEALGYCLWYPLVCEIK